MAIGVEIRCGPLAGHPAPGEEVGFADDSPVEEAGFEPSVPLRNPRADGGLSRQARSRHALGRRDPQSQSRRVHRHRDRDEKRRCGPASAPAPQDAKSGLSGVAEMPHAERAVDLPCAAGRLATTQPARIARPPPATGNPAEIRRANYQDLVSLPSLWREADLAADVVFSLITL